MTSHHIFREDELIDHCIYCNREITKDMWKSEFVGFIHYKVAKCECGRETRIKVDFDGSGDDSWIEKKIEEKIESNNTIEAKVE